MSRRKTTDPGEGTAHQEPTFEEALGNLEAIVEAMEHENLPLEDLVASYEKGTALLTRCESILQGARDRIELITLRNQAEIVLEDAALSADVAQPPTLTDFPEDSDDDDNDIRLF